MMAVINAPFGILGGHRVSHRNVDERIRGSEHVAAQKHVSTDERLLVSTVPGIARPWAVQPS